MSTCLLWSDGGEVALVVAYRRLCLVDYLTGPIKVGTHYETAWAELRAVGWVDVDGRLLIEPPTRARSGEPRPTR